jgi:hypothetical protein
MRLPGCSGSTDFRGWKFNWNVPYTTIICQAFCLSAWQGWNC